MTEPTKATPAKKPPARKAPAKKAATNPDTIAKKANASNRAEFAPTVKIMPNGRERLDHSTCGHPRTFAGRSACRTAQHKAAK